MQKSNDAESARKHSEVDLYMCTIFSSNCTPKSNCLRPSLCSPQFRNADHNHSTRLLKIPTTTYVHAFTTNATATIISANFFVATPHLQPPIPISSPQTAQCFSHLHITATTATNPLDTHHSLGGYQRNKDNEHRGFSACNSKRTHVLGGLHLKRYG